MEEIFTYWGMWKSFWLEVKWCRSAVSESLWPHRHQAPPSMGFSRQEYWSGLPFSSPGNFPTEGSNPGLPHCRQTLYHLSHQGSLAWFNLNFRLTKTACLWPLKHTLSEKAMAPHSSTLAWKIPWTEEPGRLQSMGSRRVGNDWATSLSLFTFMHWRRNWQPTPVFLSGESQGWGSLVGCRLWGRTESDTTEAT